MQKKLLSRTQIGEEYLTSASLSVGSPALLKHHWCMACSEDAYLHHGKIRVHSAAFMQAAVQSANQLSGQHGACRAGKSLCTYCAFSCSCIAKCTYCSSHLCHSQCAGRTPKQRDMSAAVVRDETYRQSGLGKNTFATLSTPEGYECVIACMRQPHLCTVSVEQHMQGPGLALVDFRCTHVRVLMCMPDKPIHTCSTFDYARYLTYVSCMIPVCNQFCQFAINIFATQSDHIWHVSCTLQNSCSALQ